MRNEITKLQSLYSHLATFLSRYDVEVGFSMKPNFTLDTNNLKSLKVACIMDEFTLLSYSPECSLLEVTPDNWKNEIESFLPNMLFIESAWQGKDGTWYRKVANGSEELYALINFCKEKLIPVVYWGKEDPIYTQTFMPVADQADYIFTTDMDSVQTYIAGTNNSHVYHLHFAAQPLRHNPIEVYNRKNTFCFAGSYYRRQVERSQLFDSFADYLISTRGLDIYDRNYGDHGYSMPEYAFPEKYKPHILGYLPSEEIDKAYKGYFFGININTITQSQTMFARRVFELLASNTVVVGNFSQGVKNYFGDLTVCTDDVATLNSTLLKHCDDTTIRKYRLKGLRKVLSEHLYEDRLSYIVEKVFGKNIKSSLPQIAVFSDAPTEESKEYVIKAFERQTYKNKSLHFSYSALCEEKIDYVAYFSPEDYYGANYLLDMALSTRYLDEDIDGITKGVDRCYNYTSTLVPRNSIIKTNFITSFENIIKDELLTGNFFAVDHFNYCRNHQGNSCVEADDIYGLYDGVPLIDIQKAVESKPTSNVISEIITLSAFETASLFNQEANKRGIYASLEGDVLKIDVNIPAGNHEYLYYSDIYPLEKASKKEYLTCTFEAPPTDMLEAAIVFLDKEKNKLGAKHVSSSGTNKFPITDALLYKSAFIKVALRFKGTGKVEFSSIKLGMLLVEDSSTIKLLKSNTMILSNIYPSYDNLYRNMFVHARVKAYQQKGYNFDVMCSNIYAQDKYREFDGVQIIDGRKQMLSDVMDSGKIETVCVHFLDEQMFAILEPHLNKLRLIVWIHGAEIHPWWRREYNYVSDKELEEAKRTSEKRMKFWNQAFIASHAHNIHFVFVSQSFANEIMEDYKIELPKERYSIIHNMIDTETFDYIEKDISQRKKIFSCRPFASRTYANDLSVKAIQALSKHKEFKDMEFYITGGAGKLFSETVNPLRNYDNVTLKERFYTHDELAALHKEYGVCLIPSRSDTQGVSRDEAMSSGLVPVTCAVAAIPEFVDDQSGILVPPEDWEGLAKGILELYHNPDLFKHLSSNAASRVREQRAKEHIIQKELGLILEKE